MPAVINKPHKSKTPVQPVRTGSLTLLITVVVLCLAVLAVLALLTAHTNLETARRQEKFALQAAAAESAGQEWLAEVDAYLVGGALPQNTTKTDGELTADLPVEDGAVLHVAVMPQQGKTRYKITRWQLERDWQADTSLNVWTGN